MISIDAGENWKLAMVTFFEMIPFVLVKVVAVVTVFMLEGFLYWLYPAIHISDTNATKKNSGIFFMTYVGID